MTKQEDRAEISMLLPWYAAGTLSAAETRRVAAAIERDPELASRLEDIRDEAAETLLLNESIAAPSRRAADRLFAAIDAEQAANPRVYAPKFSFSEWLAEKIAQVRPRTLALAGAAAAAVIVLQAGLLAGTFTGRESAGFQTATAPQNLSQGPRILVSFIPEASLADIEALLRDAGGSIVAGPQAGMYTVQIGAEHGDVDRVIQMLRDRPQIVRFAGPAS